MVIWLSDGFKVPSRIKGEAFAHHSHHLIGRLRGFIGKLNKARRVGGTLSHTVKSAHTRLLDLLLVPDCHLEPKFFGHRSGPVGQLRRGQHIGGLINQITRIVDCLAYDPSPVDRRPGGSSQP